MRAIVTGGAGFIGSHVVDALVARGDEVAVIDSLVHGSKENVPPAPSCTCATSASPRRPLRRDPAGGRLPPRRTGGRPRLGRDPVEDAEVNVVGTVRILEAARRHGAQVVFARRAEPSTASARSRRARTRRASRSRRTARRSCAEEYLAPTTASTERTSRCGTATSTGRGRTRTARRASSQSSSGARARRAGAVFGDGRQTRDYVYVGDVARATSSASAGRRRLQRRNWTRDLGRRLYEPARGSPAGRRRPTRAGAPRRASAQRARTGARGARARVTARRARRRAAGDMGVDTEKDSLAAKRSPVDILSPLPRPIRPWRTAAFVAGGDRRDRAPSAPRHRRRHLDRPPDA